MDELNVVKLQNTTKKKETGFALNPAGINRNGRPKKGQTLTDIMREVLEESLPSGVSRKEALVRKVLESAYNGNESMIRLAWNYLDGMPVQKTELTGGEGEDLSIKLVTYGSTPTISNESTTQTDTI